MGKRIGLIVFALLFPARIALAQSSNGPVTLQIGCGPATGVLCAAALPRLAARVAGNGLILRPAQGDGAVEAVCSGRLAGAFAPLDGLTQASECPRGFSIVGPPLYPLYALMIVRTDPAARPAGEAGTMAADASALPLLAQLTGTEPALPDPGRIARRDAGTALRDIAAGTLDAFVTLDTLASPLINQIRTVPGPAGAPLYRFADIRPGRAFFQAGDGHGHCLYRAAGLDFGTGAPITTVATEAVLVLGTASAGVHAKGGPKAAEALASAAAQNAAAIQTDTKTPPGWRPMAASCR